MKIVHGNAKNPLEITSQRKSSFSASRRDVYYPSHAISFLNKKGPNIFVGKKESPKISFIKLKIKKSYPFIVKKGSFRPILKSQSKSFDEQDIS